MQYAVVMLSFWKNTLKQPSTGINFFQLNALYGNYRLKEEQQFKGYYTRSIFPRQNLLIYLHYNDDDDNNDDDSNNNNNKSHHVQY